MEQPNLEAAVAKKKIDACLDWEGVASLSVSTSSWLLINMEKFCRSGCYVSLLACARMCCHVLHLHFLWWATSDHARASVFILRRTISVSVHGLGFCSKTEFLRMFHFVFGALLTFRSRDHHWILHDRFAATEPVAANRHEQRLLGFVVETGGCRLRPRRQ